MLSTHERSHKIFQDNINWLLSSDIRIKKGINRGALYGWKNLNSPSFPFIYSEITGYAITCFSWIASGMQKQDALKAARDASAWITRNIESNLLVARPPAIKKEPNPLSDMFYSFDNAMIIIGLVNLYKMTKTSKILHYAEKMAQAVIESFFDGQKLLPRLDRSFNPIESSVGEGIVKWSTLSGAYHCKLSLGFLELTRITKNQSYSRVSDLLCEYAIKLQDSSGQFITQHKTNIEYLHPHLYACEGLIYSGIKQSNHTHYEAGLKGIICSIEHIDSAGNGGLLRDTGKESVEQSDCTAQLLRLMILCRSELEKFVNNSKLKKLVERLHLRLLDFYIPEKKAKGV